MGSEDYFMPIVFLYQYLMVPKSYLPFRKLLSSIQLISELINSRDGETILHYYGIQSAIVNTKSPCIIFTKTMREETGLVLARHCNPFLQHVLYHGLNLIVSAMRMPVWSDLNRTRTLDQWNRMNFSSLRS